MIFSLTNLHLSHHQSLALSKIPGHKDVPGTHGGLGLVAQMASSTGHHGDHNDQTLRRKPGKDGFYRQIMNLHGRKIQVSKFLWFIHIDDWSCWVSDVVSPILDISICQNMPKYMSKSYEFAKWIQNTSKYEKRQGFVWFFIIFWAEMSIFSASQCWWLTGDQLDQNGGIFTERGSENTNLVDTA